MLHMVHTSHYVLKLWEQTLTYEGSRDNGRSSSSSILCYLAVATPTVAYSGAVLALCISCDVMMTYGCTCQRHLGGVLGVCYADLCPMGYGPECDTIVKDCTMGL